MTSYTVSSVIDPAANPDFDTVDGLNNAGEVIGNYLGSGVPGGGYIEDNGVYTSLSFEATAITSGGIVLGGVYGGQATLYENGTYTDLSSSGLEAGFNGSINDSGDIIAGSTLLEHNSVTAGTMIDPVLGAQIEATGINESGQIIGTALGGSGGAVIFTADTFVSNAQWSPSTTYAKGDVVIDQIIFGGFEGFFVRLRLAPRQ